MTNKILTLILIVLIAGFAFYYLMPGGEMSLGYGGFNRTQTVEHSTTSISTRSGVATTTHTGIVNTILEASDSASRREIRNESTNSVSIMLQSSTASSSLIYGDGIILDTGESYIITPDNLYTGKIVGIASSSTTTLSTIEYK